jgi:hypothetical protein
VIKLIIEENNNLRLCIKDSDGLLVSFSDKGDVYFSLRAIMLPHKDSDKLWDLIFKVRKEFFGIDKSSIQ